MVLEFITACGSITTPLLALFLERKSGGIRNP